jgi:hypothetical protein
MAPGGESSLARTFTNAALIFSARSSGSQCQPRQGFPLGVASRRDAPLTALKFLGI